MDAVRPAPQDQPADNQFFLTRQSANLMEDFIREIGRSSSLFLLYGDESIGKSWLLRELTGKRLAVDRVSWIDFKQTPCTEDNNSVSVSVADASKISSLLETANDAELIIVDHFEAASNKARHALFQGWLTDGIDKKLNVIIAASTTSFNEVRQLAQQNQIEVRSFQLLPFSRENVEAYLGFRLFPQSSLKPLSMSAEVSRQIRACKGNIGKVADLAITLKDQIRQKADNGKSQSKSIMTGTIISLLLVLVVTAWYLRPQSPGPEFEDQQVENSSAGSSTTEASIAVQAEITEPINSASTVVPEIEGPESQEPVTVVTEVVATEVTETEVEESVEPEADLEVDSGTDNKTVVVEDPVPETNATDTIELSDDTLLPNEVAQILSENRDRYSSRFLQDLESSLDWIKHREKSRTTIQIMSLDFSEFTDDTYYKYLERMQRSAIDVSLIKIYPARINGALIYGVIYGNYEDRKEANRQIGQLPAALKANQPIPRTMGGIWNEITQQ